MTKPIDISPEDSAFVLQVLNTFLPPEAKIWVFGSRAKWTTKDSSDLDIAIDAGRKLTRAEINNLTDAFAESILSYKVDIVDWNSINDSFKDIIEKDRVNIYNLPISQAAKIIGGGTPKTTNPEYWNGDISWLSVVDFNSDNRWVYNTEKTITEAGLNNSSTRILKKGQLIISARGTVGALAQLGKDMAFNQSCYGLDAIDGKAINDYLYYAIKNSISDIKLKTHGAIFDTITRQTFDHIIIPCHRIEQQAAIAAILSSLDAKIELNRKMNETLEEMAQALFKSWFVDFDPVKAKMNGQQPEGLSAELAALFPDTLVDSPLGKIPQGWKVEEIGNHLELAYGKPLKANNRESGIYPVYGSNGVIGYHNDYFVEAPGIIVGRKGNPGTIKFSSKNFYPIDTTFYVKCKSNIHSKLFWYYSLLKLNLLRLSADSAVPGLNRNAVCKCSIIVPDEQTIIEFDKLLTTFYSKISVCDSEIQSLVQIRDTLLPQLIAGKLRVQYLEGA